MLKKNLHRELDEIQGVQEGSVKSRTRAIIYSYWKKMGKADIRHRKVP